jgi:hypothetical protein
MNYFKTTLRFFVQHRVVLGLFVLTMVIALINTFHERYPDEFDNILGGKYIVQGQVIYRDFFTHHGPVPYVLSALIIPFSGISFVNFRIFYAITLVFIWFSGWLWLKDKIPEKYRLAYPVGILVLAISSIYFWGQMLLADNLAAYLILPVYVYTILIWCKARIKRKDLIIASGYLSLAALSSLSFVYLLALIYFAIMVRIIQVSWSEAKWDSSWFSSKENFKVIYNIVKSKVLPAGVIFAAPFVAFGIYLILTGSLNDYVEQNVLFNRYYVYNYPRPEGSTQVNPIRYGVVIFYTFVKNYQPVLTNLISIDLFYPFNTTLAYSNIALLGYLIFKRRFLLAMLFVPLLAFSNPRSNPFESSETDYQSAVYIVLSLANSIIVLFLFLKDNLEIKKSHLRQIWQLLGVIVIVLWFFNSYFILRRFGDKAYDKFNGTAPIIYDAPRIAPVVNSLTSSTDLVWVGPFHFEELFFVERPLASKYHILLPAMARTGMSAELLEDIRSKQPKVVYLDEQYFILGNAVESYAPEIVEYLRQNYARLIDYQGGRYKSVEPVDNFRNIETKLYIRPDYMDEAVKIMNTEGVIRIGESQQ